MSSIFEQKLAARKAGADGKEQVVVISVRDAIMQPEGLHMDDILHAMILLAQNQIAAQESQAASKESRSGRRKKNKDKTAEAEAQVAEAQVAEAEAPKTE